MKRIYLILMCICVLCAACATETVVDSTADSPDVDVTDGKCEDSNGDCTLRAAIMEANYSNNVSVITFDEGITVIAPSSALPALTASNTQIIGSGVTLDGTVHINGSADGLVIDNSSYNIIQGLTIKGYAAAIRISGVEGDARYNTIGLISGDPVEDALRCRLIGNSHGIYMYGPGVFENTVSGNLIGTQSGSTANANATAGITLTYGAHDNLIGTLTGSGLTQGGNLISGNGGVGIYIASSASNHISGNFIGTTADGMVALPNSEGIRIHGNSENNVIGIAPSGDGSYNLISGNTADGIVLDGSRFTIIAGNKIGTNDAGLGSIPNRFGVNLQIGSMDNVIGTNGDGVADMDEGNLISGNTRFGVKITDQTSTYNIIAGNYIGTNLAGTAPVPNGMGGITTEGEYTRIGTNGDGISDADEANVVSGNETVGIFIASQFNWVAGNFIGTDPTGMTAVGNSLDGIHLNADGDNNVIGTNGDGNHDDAERNIISGNSDGAGLKITGDDNVVAGNYIGTDATGAASLPNIHYGISLYETSGNLIGTDGDGVADGAEANVISGNDYGGLVIYHSHNNQVSGNMIGTDPSGTIAVPNGTGTNSQIGAVAIGYGSFANVIGTNSDGTGDAVEGNLISGNARYGITIRQAETTNNIVAGNLIGTDISGTAALPNLIGIEISDSTGNRIGTNADGNFDSLEANVISGNISDGIALGGPDNLIAGNFIGTDTSGTLQLGNGLYGIYVFSGVGAMIGGSEDGANTIAFNTQDGVFVHDGCNQIQITFNSIFSNNDTGIDLRTDNIDNLFDPNDPGDVDTGANDMLNFPTLTSAEALAAQITIEGMIEDGLPSTNFDIQLFDNDVCDQPSQHGEGKTYLGSVNAATNADGHASFQLVAQAAIPGGHFITATATTDNKTSEFSECIEVVAVTQYSLTEPRCDLFEGMNFSLVTFDPDPDRLTFKVSLQMDGEGIPGLEIPVPNDDDEWIYTAFLGEVESTLCAYEGYMGRLFCYFEIPEGYLESSQEIKFFVNGCTLAFFTHPMVSIQVPEEAPVCTRTLGEDACNAAGGTYTCGAACYCVCP